VSSYNIRSAALSILSSSSRSPPRSPHFPILCPIACCTKRTSRFFLSKEKITQSIEMPSTTDFVFAAILEEAYEVFLEGKNVIKIQN
jgi:hypothetical protein